MGKNVTIYMVLYFDDISLAFGFSTLVSIVKNDQHKKLYNMDLIQIIFKKLLYIVVGSWRNHPPSLTHALFDVFRPICL